MRRSDERAAPVRARIKADRLSDLELGGVIWAYMGPRDKQPAPPKFEWTQMPETHRPVTKVCEECNWLQALEGGIDTSHFRSCIAR